VALQWLRVDQKPDVTICTSLAYSFAEVPDSDEAGWLLRVHGGCAGVAADCLSDRADDIVSPPGNHVSS